MSIRQFSVVCKDISNSQKFVFMNQDVSFQDTNFEIMNVTKSVQINNILSAFLSNCILFVKTKSGDLNIGCYPHSFSSQEVFIQTSQIEGQETLSLEIVYQRLSPQELEKHYPKQQEVSQKSSKNNAKKSFKKSFKDLCIIDDESHSGSTTTHLNNKKIKTENLNSVKLFQEDFLQEIEQEQELRFQNRKISTISHSSQNSSSTTNVHQNQYNSQISCSGSNINNNNQNINLNNAYPSFISTSDSLSKIEDLFEQNQANQQANSSFNNNLTRSKERTIASAIKIVSQWRDLYEKYKEERIFRDLQEIAEEIGLSKKVLDYYFLELRTAEFFGFDFDSNLEQKFGKIRKFNNSHKQTYIQQNNNKKIPISGNFNYRMNQIKPNKVQSNCVSKPFKITTINNMQWANKYQQQQQQPQQQQQIQQIQAPQYNGQNNICNPSSFNQMYNFQAIHL